MLLHHRHGTRQISSARGQVGGGAGRTDQNPGAAFNACEDAADKGRMGALCVTFHTKSGRGSRHEFDQASCYQRASREAKRAVPHRSSSWRGVRPRLKIIDVIADVAAMFSVGRTFAVLTHAFERAPGNLTKSAA